MLQSPCTLYGISTISITCNWSDYYIYDQVETPGRTNLPFRIMSQVLISPSGYLQLASSQGCRLVGSIAAINTHSVWNY